MAKFLIILMLCSFSFAGNFWSDTRAYIGYYGPYFQAGIQTNIPIAHSPAFLQLDMRTLISGTKPYTIGFLPNRQDYIFGFGLNLGNARIIFSHTCFHYVMNGQNDHIIGRDNPIDEKKITLNWRF